MAQLLHARRRGVRRRVRAACRAVHWGRFDVIGERLLDLSPDGALLACDAEVRVGDELLVTFRMPWAGPQVLVMAEVTRVIGGWRQGDPGYCAGLRFLDLDPDARAALRERLAMLRRTGGARPHPVDYARTVQVIAHRPSEVGVLEDHTTKSKRPRSSGPTRVMGMISDGRIHGSESFSGSPGK